MIRYDVDVVNIEQELKKLWSASAPLTAACVLMLAAFAASVAGIFLDHRIITGVPAWLKPAKFAISTAIYTGTVAWLFRYISVWPKFTRAMGWIIAMVLILEVGIIDVQAARGTTSHFNIATTLDVALFGVMGASIIILWLASVGVLAALFRQRFPNKAWGWALRLGMLITVLGSASGGLMLRMQPQQVEAARMHLPLTAAGGHTVGAPDGGPGLPGVGWSTQHGDLRVPHFFGLHGVQIIPLLGWLIARRRRVRAPLIFTIAGSYLVFVAILTWQALRGQSVISPDAATLAVLAVWLFGTLVAVQVLRKKTSVSEGAPDTASFAV
jgi:hypothetical protein